MEISESVKKVKIQKFAKGERERQKKFYGTLGWCSVEQPRSVQYAVKKF